MDSNSPENNEKIFYECKEDRYLVTDRLFRYGNLVIPLKDVTGTEINVAPIFPFQRFLMRVGFFGSFGCFFSAFYTMGLSLLLLPLTAPLYFLFLRAANSCRGHLYIIARNEKTLIMKAYDTEPDRRYGYFLFNYASAQGETFENIVPKLLPLRQAIGDAMAYRLSNGD